MAPGTDAHVAKSAQRPSAEDPVTAARSRVGTVAYYALLSRLAIWLLATASHVLIQDYDSALELVLPIDTPGQQLFKSIFGVFLRWDSFYFVDIAERGYAFEQILVPLDGILTYRQRLVVAGVLVANATFVAAAVQIYNLTNVLFKRERFAFMTAMLYVLTPSGIFMSAIYTESAFAALSFTGMLLAARQQYLLAAITWSVSCTARANGILYAGFFLYDLVVKMDLSASLWTKFKALVKAACLCLITWTGFVAVQAYGYSLYCVGDTLLDARPWCGTTVPLIYTFVQDFYWNVGFLRYYEIKQIPNFLMAAPMITLSTAGIYYYATYDLTRLFSLGRLSVTGDENATRSFLSGRAFPFIALWAVLLLSAVTTMHVQIITRAFSCLPPVYWYAAHQFERQGKAVARGAGWTRTVSTFFVMYGLVGIILFANFFPPA
ncbi:hypothetical protein BGZ99_005659 [Dissophora globulifera]|uniref:GPI mannosyltransferase 2 n=1 Tax=Dissophora globulifera TaxID=979702 RepID=A0A9P6UZY6_9FUNG|nr:hypothetical protein BGZ99_005659 [Dissophora globulifera]